MYKTVYMYVKYEGSSFVECQRVYKHLIYVKD
jgi:hypothetical protein